MPRLRPDRYPNGVDLPDRVDDPTANVVELVELIDVGAQDDELITADPSDDIDRPNARTKRIGHGNKQIISLVMAMEVIDQLEVVQIAVKHRHPTAARGDPT